MTKTTKSIPERIAEVRGKIAALKAERSEVHRAPLPREEVQERIRAEVSRLASGFRPDVGGLMRPGGDGPDLLGTRELGHGAGHVRSDHGALFAAQITTELGRGVVAMLAALAPEALEDRLMAAVGEALHQAAPGLPAAERPERLAELDAEVLDLERQEEELIEATERDGRPIARRGDAAPEAVLGWEAAA